jgi:large subunit ribosomal protein L21
MKKESYAIIESGGKQYKVAAGDRVKLDYLDIEVGKEVELSPVLVIADEKDTIIGTPAIENARVKATCVSEGKGKKIIVFKYKPKTRYRVKKGHRQLFTQLEINEIIGPGKKPSKAAPQEKSDVGGKS